MVALSDGTNSRQVARPQSLALRDIATSRQKVPSNSNYPKMASAGRVPQGEVIMDVSLEV